MMQAYLSFIKFSYVRKYLVSQVIVRFLIVFHILGENLFYIEVYHSENTGTLIIRFIKMCPAKHDRLRQSEMVLVKRSVCNSFHRPCTLRSVHIKYILNTITSRHRFPVFSGSIQIKLESALV